MLMFVNDLTRLAVISEARNTKALGDHLRHNLAVILTEIGARQEWIESELAAMQPVSYARSQNRSILSTMTDFKLGIFAELDHENVLNYPRIMKFLSEYPIGPLGYDSPEPEPCNS